MPQDDVEAVKLFHRQLRQRDRVPHVGPRIVLRHPIAAIVFKGEIEMGCREVLFSGAAKPFYRLDIVLRHTASHFVHITEIVLGLGKALGRRFAVQTDRNFIVLLDAATLVVHHSQAVLGKGIAFLGGLAVPRKGLVVVLGDVEARLKWAAAKSCSAARRNHFTASTSSCGTPRPTSYI